MLTIGTENNYALYIEFVNSSETIFFANATTTTASSSNTNLNQGTEKAGNGNRLFECRDRTDKKDRLLYSAAKGKETAEAVHSFLSCEENKIRKNKSYSLFGRMNDKDKAEFMKLANPDKRNDDLLKHNSIDEIRVEAGRCLDCDCVKKHDCGLRDLSTEYHAQQRAYAGEQSEFDRKIFADFILEPVKGNTER